MIDTFAEFVGAFAKDIRLLSNFDIIYMCKKLEITNFKGCFMRDEINSLKSSKIYNSGECFLMNTDDSSSSGTHWTAVNVTDGTTFYFDSYGLYPTMEMREYCNEPRFFKTFENQKPNEVICGHLCFYIFL